MIRLPVSSGALLLAVGAAALAVTRQSRERFVLWVHAGEGCEEARLRIRRRDCARPIATWSCGIANRSGVPNGGCAGVDARSSGRSQSGVIDNEVCLDFSS
jgi:hypothetical protein